MWLDIYEKNLKYCIHGLGTGFEIHGTTKAMVEGRGSIVRDIDGKEYIDFVSGTMTPLAVGYNHPKVVEAIKRQADKLVHVASWFPTPARVELAEKLAKIAPYRMKDNCKTIFSCSGSDAIELAVIFAMSYLKRSEVISLEQGYHGRTIACVNMAGWGGMKTPAGYPLPRIGGFHQIPPAYCYRCPWGQAYPGCDLECAQALESAIEHACAASNVAAFILEPILGPAGHIPFPPEYYKLVRDICNKHGILIIVDEIQLSLGRTGKVWASETQGLEPDIIATGKGISGGMPLAATMIRADMVDDELTTGDWGLFTYSGTPIVCAAGSAAIDIMIEERLPEKAARQGGRITKRLREMQDKHPLIGDVRGPGLFIGVEFVKDKQTKKRAAEEAKKISSKMFEKGVITGLNMTAGPLANVLKIKPPLAISDEQVDTAMEKLEESLNETEG